MTCHDVSAGAQVCRGASFVPFCPIENRALHLLDGVGDQNAAWARFGAIDDGLAGTDATSVVAWDARPLSCATIAAVEDETMRVDDGGRTDLPRISPDLRAGASAGPVEDALGAIIVACALLG